MKIRKGSFKRIISLILLSTFLFQLDGIKVLAAELNSNNVGRVTTEEQNQFIINSFNMEKNDSIYEEDRNIKFSIDISNPELVNYITLNYSSDDWYNPEIELYFNESTGLFEGITYLGWAEIETQYNLESIYLSTRYGTITLDSETLMNEHNIDVNQYYYTIGVWSLIINDISIDKNMVYHPNDFLIINADINKARINSVDAIYEDNKGSEVIIPLYYDDYNKVFTGQFYTNYDVRKYGDVFTFKKLFIDTYSDDIYLDREELLKNYEVDSSNLDFIVQKWAPIVRDIELESNEVEYPNGSIKVYADIENIEEVKWVQVYFKNSYDYLEYVSLEYNQSTGRFEGDIFPNSYYYEDYERNSYIFDSVILANEYRSVNYNSEKLQSDFGIDTSQLNYTVKRWKPIINSIELSSNELLYPNGSIKVTIDIENGNNIHELRIAYTNMNSASDSISLSYNSDINKFEGTIEANNYYYDYSNLGNSYDIDYIFISTTNESMYIYRDTLVTEYGIDLQEVGFTLSKWKPTVNSIEVESNTIEYPNGSTKIYVDIEEIDQIQSISAVYNRNDYYGYPTYQYINLYYDYELCKYVGTIWADEYDYSYLNNYTFEKLEVITKNGEYVDVNRWDLDIDTMQLDYIVKKWRPTINSINLEKNVIYPNVIGADSTGISIDIENKEEISSVSVTYGSEYHDYSTSTTYLYYNDVTGLFEGTHSPYYYGLGTSVIKSITIYKDGYGVTLDRNELISNNINLESTNVEIIPYTPSYIFANKASIKTGEEVNIDLDLSNYPFDIYNVTLNYYIADGKGYRHDFSVNMTYNEDRGIFEGKFTAGNLTTGGLKEIHSITIEGSNGYSTIYNDGYQMNLSAANFEVVNNIDKFIYSLKVEAEKDSVEVGEGVKVSLSGINLIDGNITATYTNIETDEIELINLVYNRITKTYEGYFNKNVYLATGIWALDNITIGEVVGNNYNYITVYNREIHKLEKYTKDFSKADIEIREADNNIPSAPIISTGINNKTTVLEGKAQPGSTVVIEKEVKVFGGVKVEEIIRVVADSNGNFKVKIPQQSVNTVIGVKSINSYGTVSGHTMLIVKNINRADVNVDDIVDILDIAYVARDYNFMIGDEEWNSDMDVNEDEVVDIFDIILVSKQMK